MIGCTGNPVVKSRIIFAAGHKFSGRLIHKIGRLSIRFYQGVDICQIISRTYTGHQNEMTLPEIQFVKSRAMSCWPLVTSVAD